MTQRVFVPGDAAAIAVGADDVATAIRQTGNSAGHPVEIVRTGSRGMLWLEPLVEIESDGVRHGFGPLDESEVEGLAALGLFGQPTAGLLGHPRSVGPVERISYFARQRRLTFARCGVIDPLSLDAYRATRGYAGLSRALSLTQAAIVDDVTRSGLRGRGGAGFPTGIKWKTVLETPSDQKYIVCNADEGDSGTFADRLLMEGDPFTLIEGMTIAGLAVGASKGFIYVRSEYPHAIVALRKAVAIARQARLLGSNVADSGRGFDLDVRIGAGSYVCGEETALLESLEGRRGIVRAKPPLPAHHGLFGRPTVINNVLTLAAIPFILAEGAAAYAGHGVGRSRGTTPIQLAGNVLRGGLFETAFGITLGELVLDVGGGTASGRPVRAAQTGGPLGAYFPPALFDTPFDYEAFAARQGLIGHGGIVVFDDTVDMARQAQFAFEFCAIESCGKCTPCRIGSTRGAETMAKVVRGEDREQNLALITDLCQTMSGASACALGGLTPYPVLSALKHFPEDFRRGTAC
jgi:formate dehydrogenase iron-sulfur subunit